MALLDRILADRGLTRADMMKGTTRLGKLMRRDGVPASDELTRILALPRREEIDPELVPLLTQLLVKEGSKEELWEHQALALKDLYDLPGVFADFPVGTGKTLVTLVAATLLESKRPVLMVSATLKKKTLVDYQELQKDWKVVLPTLLTYSMLGHKMHEDDLEELNPDLLMLDEADKAANRGSSVVRRIARYLRGHPDTKVATLSGTLIGTALLRYQHLMRWTLGPELMPLPSTVAETKVWGQAIDHDVELRLDPGALSSFGSDVHEGLSDFTGKTPGIVRVKGSRCAASIVIERWTPTYSDRTMDTLKEVAKTSVRPDGVELEDFELPRCLAQLALDFYYVWDPLPPKEWMTARRAWFSLAREYLGEFQDGLDSESQVRDAVREERIDGIGILARWEQVEPTFKPNKVAMWVDKKKSVLRQALEKAGKSCLIWSRFTEVGKAFEEMGIPHFGENGLDSSGMSILDSPGGVVSCAIQSCSIGFNLQHKWSRNLVLTPMSSNDPWEQMIGRTHRPKQKADSVGVIVIDSIAQHRGALQRAIAEAKYIQKMSGAIKKLTLADFAG